MADKKVIEGTNITASQMKEFWRLVDVGALNRAVLQELIEKHKEQPPRVLVVDRTTPFIPAIYYGRGWKIEEQDNRALLMKEIDFKKVSFETCINVGERPITGEEKLKRHVEAGHVCADAGIGRALCEEEGQKTLEYLREKRDIRDFELFGTIFLDPQGYRCVMRVYQRSQMGHSFWGMDSIQLFRHFHEGYRSLVLAST
jgi:hypothetical protein